MSAVIMYMKVCMVVTYSKRRINLVRLPYPLLVSLIGKMKFSLSPFAPENLISRDGFGSLVPSRVGLLLSILRLNLVLTGFLLISAAASIYSFKPPYAIGSVPSLSGHAIAYR